MNIEERLAKLEEKVFGKSTPQEAWDSDVMELKCGVKVAKTDYYEIANGEKKTQFTWDEAMKIEEKTNGKWRLPTQQEWLMIYAELGCKDGKADRDTFVNALGLTEDEDGCGCFWSASELSAKFAYYLYFSSSYVYPEGNEGRAYAQSVRCVAESGSFPNSKEGQLND